MINYRIIINKKYLMIIRKQLSIHQIWIKQSLIKGLMIWFLIKLLPILLLPSIVEMNSRIYKIREILLQSITSEES